VKFSFQQLEELVPAASGDVDWAACLECYPSLHALSATPQDPTYHAEGDVWTHTKMVVNALVNGDDYRKASDEQRFILFHSALLHDIAKPGTTVIDEATGKISQPGHSPRGAIDTRILLWRAGAPFEVREQICRIIGAHQTPFFAMMGHGKKRNPEFIARKLSHELDIHLLCAVAEADIRGRISKTADDTLTNIELFREVAREEGCYGHPFKVADQKGWIRYLDGADVDPRHPFFREQGSRVIVLSGLPATGKNRWVLMNGDAMPVISFDDAKAELGLAHGENDGKAAHHAIDQAKVLLRGKQDFIWNATHLSRQMRKKTVDLLMAYGADVEIRYLEATEPELMSRNSKRDTTLRNEDIEKMLLRWEVPLPTEAHVVEYEVQAPGNTERKLPRPRA